MKSERKGKQRKRLEKAGGDRRGEREGTGEESTNASKEGGETAPPVCLPLRPRARGGHRD